MIHREEQLHSFPSMSFSPLAAAAAAAAASSSRLSHLCSPKSMSTISSSNPSQPKKVRVQIKGRVQGVFFRDWTVENARELGLVGWVRNRRDGSVEAVFAGDPSAVDEMVERRCRVGPPAAIVTAVNCFDVDDGEVEIGGGFQRKPTS